MNYWKQKAATWVSLAVLLGGLVSAGVLLWITKIEAGIEKAQVSSSYIE